MSWENPGAFQKIITHNLCYKHSPLTGVQHRLLDLKDCFQRSSSVGAAGCRLGSTVRRQHSLSFQTCTSRCVLRDLSQNRTNMSARRESAELSVHLLLQLSLPLPTPALVLPSVGFPVCSLLLGTLVAGPDRSRYVYRGLPHSSAQFTPNMKASIKCMLSRQSAAGKCGGNTGQCLKPFNR